MQPGPCRFFANPGEPKPVKSGIQDLAKNPTGVVRRKAAEARDRVVSVRLGVEYRHRKSSRFGANAIIT
jgi:hypothetical protein